jgi:cytochrome c556
MKSIPLFAATAVILAATLLTARAADTALEKSMHQIADATKQLGTDLKQTDDTKHNKDADLKCIDTINTQATASHDLTPKKEKTLPPDQQTAMTADYQKDMAMFLKDIDALNTDVTAENWPVARTDFKRLIDDEKAGHDKYRIKKK